MITPVLVLALSLSPESPGPGLVKAARVAVVAMVAGQTADTLTTIHAMRRGGYETNPLLPGSPTGVALVKSVVVSAAAVVLWKGAKKHPWPVAVGCIIVTGMTVGAAVHNRQVGR